jgi:hypothetical protein
MLVGDSDGPASEARLLPFSPTTNNQPPATNTTGHLTAAFRRPDGAGTVSTSATIRACSCW